MGTQNICPRCQAINLPAAQSCFQCSLQFQPRLRTVSAKRGGFWKWVLFGGLGAVALVGLIFMAAVVNAIYQGKLGRTTTPPSIASQSPLPISPTVSQESTLDRSLVLVQATWQKSGPNTVAIWKVTLKNTSDRPIGDIRYRTAYFSEIGNQVGKGGVDAVLGGRMIQKVIPPKSTRIIEVNDGFTHIEAHHGTFDLVDW